MTISSLYKKENFSIAGATPSFYAEIEIKKRFITVISNNERFPSILE